MKAYSGFYKKTFEERLEILRKERNLTDEEVKILGDTGALKRETADRMIENVFGVIHLPVGIATNFKINGKELVIPMAVEEPSIIAAASNAAKMTLPEGFTADADEPIMVGQIQLVGIENVVDAIKKIETNKDNIFKSAKEFAKGMEQYGGGVKAFSTRKLSTPRGDMLMVEFDIDVRDAMGANTINTVLEGTAPILKDLVGGKIRLRILSNLAVKRKVRSQAIWKKEIIGEEVIEGILDGYELAKADIYRCATHNKGIMNGIDSVVIATGNDWRAVEAGAHTFAAMNGYTSLSHYEKTKEGDLLGRVELPLAVGTVGGAINTKPTPKIMFKIMGIKTAKELSMAMASVGLSNNFAALRALATEGIQKGHMKLHARNLAVIAGAETPEEIETVCNKLDEQKIFTAEKAKEILNSLRDKK